MKPLTRAARLRAPTHTSCTRTISGAVVCRFAGDVDADSAPAATKALLSCLDQVPGRRELFLDLAGVRRFCAAGLTALLTLREAAVTARVPLILVAPSPVVCRVLELTDSRQLFTIMSRLQPAPGPS